MPDYSSPATDFEKLGLFLSTPLPIGNKAQTKRAIAEAVSWLGRVSWLKREAEYHYRKDKNIYLLPKAKDYTDLDREVRVKADIADVAKDYHYLQDLEQALLTYIDVAKLFLTN